MLNGRHVAIVLPAFNAARTLEPTVRDLPGIVDTRILVDDGSGDET
ncbi:MAG: glycosyl transferase family 2, partial [Acidobacteria bacterium]